MSEAIETLQKYPVVRKKSSYDSLIENNWMNITIIL